MNCYLVLFRGQKRVIPDEGILDGITRRVALGIARRHFPADVREVQHGELFCAKETFIPGSNMEIVPVVQADGSVIGSGKPGPRTSTAKHAMQGYTSRLAAFL